MRKLNRLPSPSQFAENAAKWNQQWIDLRTENPSASFQWYSANGKTARDWALPVLKEMTQGHCSFCDNFPLDFRDEPIEHLKPKSTAEFQHLAYEWGNLYYCCGTCNSYKNDSYNAAALEPDEPTYNPMEFFYFDSTTGEIKVNDAAPEENQERARATIKLFGLDEGERPKLRKIELQKWFSRAPDSEVGINDFAFRDFLDS